MKFQSINPATEELLAEFESINLTDALTCGRVCRTVQKKWRLQSIADRCTLIKKLAEILRAEIDQCARLMTLEMGKPISQSKAEVEKCGLLCDYYANNAIEFLKEDIIQTEAKKSYVRFDPLGVLLCIMPWNFPFWQVVRFAVPALIAGNGILLKHASNVPQCALRIEEIFRKAGFPDGLFKTLLIDSATATELLKSDAVDAVSLTGSTAAGQKIASVAGQYIKKCVLELGGSDAFIVLQDAAVPRASETAVSARLICNGQSCVAAKRFIVEKSIAGEFEKQAVEYLQKQRIGDPLDATTTVGPLAKAEIRQSIEKQVTDAVLKGAKVLVGGKSIPQRGYYFEPTLLTNITPETAVYKEEVFGPVMTLFIVNNVEEAVRFANDSEYGLGASIWTSDLAVAEKMAIELEAGVISINGMVKSDPRLPFGGVKKSGFGRELGSYGIKEFVNVKTVVVN